MYFISNDGYQNCPDFVPMLNSLTLNNNKKVTDWIPDEVSPKKTELFHSILATIMHE